jgi:membrane-associated protein
LAHLPTREDNNIESAFSEWITNNRHLAPLVVSGLAFAESCVGIGIFVSGALLLIATTLLYHNGIVDLYQIGFLAFFGAIAGDQVGFWVGYRAGPGFHHTRLAKRYAKQLAKGESMVLRHYIPAIRSLVPALLGVAGYDRRKYVVLDILACGTWAVALCLLSMLGSTALG